VSRKQLVTSIIVLIVIILCCGALIAKDMIVYNAHQREQARFAEIDRLIGQSDPIALMGARAMKITESGDTVFFHHNMWTPQELRAQQFEIASRDYLMAHPRRIPAALKLTHEGYLMLFKDRL